MKRLAFGCLLLMGVGAASSRAFAVGSDFTKDEIAAFGKHCVHGFWVNQQTVLFFAGDAAQLNGDLTKHLEGEYASRKVVIHPGTKRAESPWDTKARETFADWSVNTWDDPADAAEAVPRMRMRIDVWLGAKIQITDLRIPKQFEVVSLVKQDDGKAKDLASSPPRATVTERSPEESLLSGHKVKVTPASLQDFLKSLQGDPAERPENIQRLIHQLGSDIFAQREAASAKLLALAVAPVKELTAALDHPDAEIRRRARMILDRVGQRVPASALLFAALLVIRDRELNGLAAEVLMVVPLCDSQPLRTAARQAMRATVRREDRPLLERASAHDNVHVRAIAAAGLAVIDARTEPPRPAPVTWVDLLDTYLVHGRYDGERTDFLKGIPESLAMHFERTTRTANTIDAVVNRHDTSPWLYPVRGKNERPRALVEAGKKHYPIQGSWRQHWTQWIVLDENGKHIQGGAAQEPHTESCVDFLVVPLSTSKTPRRRQPEAEAGKTITLPVTVVNIDAGARVLSARSRVFQYAGMGKSICKQVPDDKFNRTARILDGTGGVIIVKPTRMEDLSISASAKIKAGGKDIQLTDLKAGDHVDLELTASEGGLVVIGIERVDAGGEKSGEKPLPKGEDAGIKKEPSAAKHPAQRDGA